MQWSSKHNAGFCSSDATPWLPVPPSYKERNVESELQNPDSLLNCYKRFLKARKETPSLNSGDIKIIDIKDASEDILSYLRTVIVNGKEQNAYVFLNYSDKTNVFTNPSKKAKLLVSTNIDRKNINKEKISLDPQEGIVLIN